MQGASHTQDILGEKMQSMQSEMARYEKMYVILFYTIVVCNQMIFAILILGSLLQNRKFHVCNGVSIIFLGFAVFGFLTFLGESYSKFLYIPNEMC